MTEDREEEGLRRWSSGQSTGWGKGVLSPRCEVLTELGSLGADISTEASALCPCDPKISAENFTCLSSLPSREGSHSASEVDQARDCPRAMASAIAVLE